MIKKTLSEVISLRKEILRLRDENLRLKVKLERLKVDEQSSKKKRYSFISVNYCTIGSSGLYL
jgi:hypothetical protein